MKGVGVFILGGQHKIHKDSLATYNFEKIRVAEKKLFILAL